MAIQRVKALKYRIWIAHESENLFRWGMCDCYGLALNLGTESRALQVYFRVCLFFSADPAAKKKRQEEGSCPFEFPFWPTKTGPQEKKHPIG